MKTPTTELMSETTFESQELIARWKRFFEENPFGDYYRLSTINPLVLQTARWAMLRKTAADLIPFPVDAGTAIFSQLGDHSDLNPESTFKEFHSQLVELSRSWKPLSGLQILDLGCGTGYRAEILANLGAGYIGVDRRLEFVRFAKQQFKNLPNTKFDLVDLDTFHSREKPFRLPEADLALSVMVLEHLAAPETLLQRLRALAANRPLVLLLVTENPSYYRPSLADVTDVRHQRTARVPIVCLRGMEVNVNVRKPHDISILLRDAGFTVLEDGYNYLPGKWPNFVRAHYGCKARLDVNWGLAPFRSIVAQPLPVTTAKGAVSFESLVENSALRELKQRPHHAMLEEIKREGAYVALPPGRVLLTRRDLGGCLYFVTRGSLSSEHQPEGSFTQFDCFGELEANHGLATAPRFGFFIDDLRAGDHGAEVFVLPEPIASKLLSREGGFVNVLFGELRRKVLSWNDRVTLRSFTDASFNEKSSEVFSAQLQRRDPPVPIEDGRFKDVPPALAAGFVLQNPRIPLRRIQKYDLGRMAGALWSLSELENQTHQRGGDFRVVFCDIATLQKITEIRDENSAGRLLRLLTVLGVIDAILPGSLNAYHDGDPTLDDRIVTGLVDFLVQSAENQMIAAGWRDQSRVGRCIANLRQVGAQILQAEWFRLKAQKHGQTTRYFHEIQSQLQSISNGLEELHGDVRKAVVEALDKARTGFLQLNLLFKEGKPRFFVVHDAPFLRTLAYGTEGEVDQALVIRALTKVKGQDLEIDVAKQDSFSAISTMFKDGDEAYGRVRYFAAALTEFLINDWQKAGTLRYSAGDASGLELPANIKLT